MRLTVTSTRLAEPQDWSLLPDIEKAVDAQLAASLDSATVGSLPVGRERVAEGVVLVVGNPALGFAHLVELDDGGAYLERLAVHPLAQRRGLGRLLLHAVYGLVRDRGLDRVSVTTDLDAPYYAAHGFTAVAGPSVALTAATARGRAPHLDRQLSRVVMERVVRDEPTPIPAVSVLPLHEGPGSLEVFVQHRAATMDFVPGALVFPGGRVDLCDTAAGEALDLAERLVREHTLSWQHTAFEVLGNASRAARTVLACAVREVAEETGAVIDPARLLPWDNWETPLGLPKRFDVRFLLLPVRTTGEAMAFTHATTEARTSHWMPVRDVARGADDSSLHLVAPTRVLVEELALLGSLDAAAALRPTIRRVRDDICPTPARRGRLPAG